MKALVIGYGSIGKRHCRLLQTQKLRPSDIHISELQEKRVEDALSAGHQIYNLNGSEDKTFDIVVVASSTASHISILKMLPKIKKLLYIEKPLAHNFLAVAPIARRLKKTNNKAKIVVGYMLRQHPAVQVVKKIISENKLGQVLKYRAECGMFLPNWHPWEDYRDFYMSDIDGGGGALLDISHEIDLVSYLVGPTQRVFGILGNLSSLDCTSDDFTEITLQHRNGAIGSISLDLIQKDTFRKTRLVFEKGEVEINFIAKTLTMHTDVNEFTSQEFHLDGDDLYLSQYKDALDESCNVACSIDEGLNVMEIIHAVRRSSEIGSFINLPIYSGIDG